MPLCHRSDDDEVMGVPAAAPVETSESRKTASIMWIERYRPSSLSELISQGDIITTGVKATP